METKINLNLNLNLNLNSKLVTPQGISEHSPNGLKISKWEPVRFFITLFNIKEPKTPGITWNHLKNVFFVSMIYFTKRAQNPKNGNQLGSI